MRNLDFHHFASMLPLIQDTDKGNWKAFLESVRVSGVRQKLVLYEGKILDGRNRYLAVKHWEAAGVEISCRFETFNGNAAQALQLVKDHNTRRDMTSSQRAALAFKYYILDQEIERANIHNKANGTSAPQISEWTEDVVQSLLQQFGTNRDYLYKVHKIYKADPQILDKVLNGDLTIPQAMDYLFHHKNERQKNLGKVKEQLIEVRKRLEAMGEEEEEALVGVNSALRAIREELGERKRGD